MSLKDELVDMKACPEAVEWVGDKTIEEAWTTCERADWMLWYASSKAPHALVVRAACACARMALRFVPDGEDRPRLAIEAAERWANNPTEENRAAAGAAGAAARAAWAAAWAAADAAGAAARAAWAAAWAAADAAGAAGAAGGAAWAAADAASAAWAAAGAAGAAWAAADAAGAARAAADAASAAWATGAAEMRDLADIVRKHIALDDLTKEER